MAEKLELPAEMAKKFIKNYYARYPGVKLFQQKVASEVQASRKPSKFRTNGVITHAVAADWGTTVGDIWRAIQTGDTYVNVHTDANPGGEIRGQLTP